MDQFQLFRQVIKDYNIPINFTTELEFFHAWNTLEACYNLNQKAEKLKLALVDNNLNLTKEYFNKVKQSILDSIKNQESYQKLSQEKNIGEQFEELKNLYKVNNHGKIFISIDMVKANFSVMRKALPEIFGKGSYEEFIHTHCPADYFKESKYIRQYLFGNLNPKLQQNMQKRVINQVVNSLSEKYPQLIIVHKTADELVLLADSVEQNKSEIENLLKQGELSEYQFRVEMFRLNALMPYDFYVKEHLDVAKVEFKNIPSVHLMEAIRYYRKEESHELDRRFTSEGRVAVFCSPLKFNEL